jgi:trehalose 6-phosphate phosphatase
MAYFEIPSIFGLFQWGTAEFREWIARASTRVLLLDCDGTLAPFSADRKRVAPYAEILPLLRRIQGDASTRLIVVTGREAHEAAGLLGLNGVEVWGCHGMSRLRADGSHEMQTLDATSLAGISEAHQLLREEGLSELLELKTGAVAVHWRGVSSDSHQVAHLVQKVWRALSSRRGLELLEFDGGLEIRVSGSNKGDAVRTVLAELDGDAAVAYLGDDITDESAFEALRGRGLSVLVRSEFRPTNADVWIRPPDGVAAFLAEWADACGGAS